MGDISEITAASSKSLQCSKPQQQQMTLTSYFHRLRTLNLSPWLISYRLHVFNDESTCAMATKRALVPRLVPLMEGTRRILLGSTRALRRQGLAAP
jgi:hypothetical protein